MEDDDNVDYIVGDVGVVGGGVVVRVGGGADGCGVNSNNGAAAGVRGGVRGGAGGCGVNSKNGGVVRDATAAGGVVKLIADCCLCFCSCCLFFVFTSFGVGGATVYVCVSMCLCVIQKEVEQ